MFDKSPSPKPQQVKKFYFLDYFYILLESCELDENKVLVFSNFRFLKDQARLGESKYRKLLAEHETEKLSERQVQRYRYTFDQVISEAANYGLIISQKERVIITPLGKKCLAVGRKNRRSFYYKILQLMESNYFAFYHLVNFCYEQNSSKNGLLIFPIYSPRKLGFEKSNMKMHKHWINYTDQLRVRLEKDIFKYIEKRIDLKEANEVLIQKLVEDKILSRKSDKEFDQTKYNAIIGRIRKYWLNYFLKDIYHYNFSFDTFSLWVERGKQLGIVHSSEIYPEFDGKLVFPTSVIIKKNNNPDLKEIYSYENALKLFSHIPEWERTDSKQNPVVQNTFVESLYHSYYDLRRTRKSHFVRLSDLREKVCYKMRIPMFVFNDFLEKAYLKNLRGELPIQISLEADRLPQETNAMYLKREPLLINGQYKNIIAIDYK